MYTAPCGELGIVRRGLENTYVDTLNATEGNRALDSLPGRSLNSQLHSIAFCLLCVSFNFYMPEMLSLRPS